VGTPLIVLLLTACDSDVSNAHTDNRISSPTEIPSSINPPTVGTRLESLREFDFEESSFVSTLTTRTSGGEINPARVQFEDLTSDGLEEAVVVVESGGTAGDIGVAIYGLIDGVPEVLFFKRLSGHVEVRLGSLVIQEGVYHQGDAECCPTQLIQIAYGWSAGDFRVISEQILDNPQR